MVLRQSQSVFRQALWACLPFRVLPSVLPFVSCFTVCGKESNATEIPNNKNRRGTHRGGFFIDFCY
jgi:hypothetical protein